MGTFFYVSQYTVLPKSYNYYTVRKKIQFDIHVRQRYILKYTKVFNTAEGLNICVPCKGNATLKGISIWVLKVIGQKIRVLKIGISTLVKETPMTISHYHVDLNGKDGYQGTMSRSHPNITVCIFILNYHSPENCGKKINFHCF